MMPHFIRFETARKAAKISRTPDGQFFIIKTASGVKKKYPNSNYNNSIICSARSALERNKPR